MQAITEIRDAQEAEAWLAAGSLLVRVGVVEEGGLDAVDTAALKEICLGVLTETGSLVPAGAVWDLARLIRQGTQATCRKSAQLQSFLEDEALIRALRSWEEHLLNRLLIDPSLDNAADLIQGDASPTGPVLFAIQLLSRLPHPEASILPGVIRRFFDRPLAEQQELGFAVLRERADIRAGLAECYEAMALSTRRTATLLPQTDLFVLAHRDSLAALGQRLAAAQLRAAQAELEAAIPKRLRRIGRPRGQTPTMMQEESTYPIGGFSSMSTAGSIENLVSSELIYMEKSSVNAGNLDLFQLRWAEGELLYYSRDENVYFRQHREICWLLTPLVERERIKDPPLPYQRIVHILASILFGTTRIMDLLGEHALKIRVYFCNNILAEERKLVELALSDGIAQGIVEVTGGELEAALQQATKAGRIGYSDVVWIGEPARKVEKAASLSLNTRWPDTDSWHEDVEAVVRGLL
jgi:hypothetical protein